MKRLALALGFWLAASAAFAQQVINPAPNAGVYGAYNSGTQTCVTGTGCWLQTDINGLLKITGTVTVTPSGTQNVAITSPLGGGTQAAAVRTTLATDSPGVIALGQTTKSASVPVTIATDQYVDPCQSPNIAKSSVAISIATATTTSLVGVSGSTTVYVCGFVFTASQVITTANTLVFEYGTGATCTSPTALTGTLGAGGITAGEPILVHAGNAGQTIFKSAASAGICALTAIGASGSFQGVLTFVQQ